MNLSIIICFVFIIAVITWVSQSSSNHEVEILPSENEVKQVEQKMPAIKIEPTLPQKFRRWQQSLIHREGRVVEREVYQTYKEREISFQEQGLSLSQREVEVKDLANEVQYMQKLGRLEKKEMMIEVQGKRVELKEILNQIGHRENLMEIRDKEITLNGQKVELKDLFNQIIAEGRSVELSKKDLAVESKMLEQTYREKNFKLEQVTANLRYMIMDFKLDKKEWSAQKKQESLQLYEGKLKLLESNIDQMYNIKLKWLEIEAKENSFTNREERLNLNSWESDLNNREERLSLNQERAILDDTYAVTQTKIRELRLERESINLLWDRRDLDNKWQKLKNIEASWTFSKRLE
jgi:hypothetical protein